jgi:predicted NUDIX family NTP pyrophosphohydrolase
MAKRSKQSAGLMMYRRSARGLEVFLAHPGGPFFARKDLGAWTIPKGEPNPGEALLSCALREFEEETGMKPEGDLLELGEVQQAGGKRVAAWALEGDFGERELRCNHVEIEWPPRSGKMRSIPEIDRAEYFTLEEAREKLNPAQVPLLERLLAKLG